MAINRTVAVRVQNMLPAALIEYLWGLAAAKQEASGHTFVLRRRDLGGREIQEILHVTGLGTDVHRVFGFAPAEAVIRISACGDGMHMKTGRMAGAPPVSA